MALRAHLGHAVVSLERGCPPPGLLACRPGVRVTALLPSPPPPWVRVAVPAAVAHGLRVFGYRDLVVHAAERGFAGRVAARGEVLGRWQQADEILEIAVGGLELRDPAARREELERGPALALDPAVLAALERDASP